MKTCSRCKQSKDLSEFHKKGNKHHCMCKACRKVYIHEHYLKKKDSYAIRTKKWKEENKLKVLATRYSVSIETVQEIMSANKCQICSSTKKLVFDHIHATGEPRGCLCHQCNTMLGRLGDTNEEIFSKMAEITKYLKL